MLSCLGTNISQVIRLSKILIAIRSETIAECLSSSLNSCYKTFISQTGPEALRALENFHPDILIIDLMLPQKDGITVLSSSSYKPPVILAITTYINQEILSAAGEAGIGGLVLLPSSIDAILSLLESLINDKQYKAPLSKDN